MKKLILIFLALTVLGCSGAKQEQKIIYKTKVIVNEGFYKDQIGEVLYYYRPYYTIKLEDGNEIQVHGDYLTLQ